MARFRRASSLGLVLLASLVAGSLSGCNAVSGYTANESGRAYYRQGDFARAQQSFRRAALDHPQNADYVHNLASALEKEGNLVGAEQTYRQALHVDPMHQPSYHQLAQLLSNQNRHAEAVDLLEHWVGSQPYSPEARVEMAWMQRQFGDVTGAERSLREALKLQPNHSVALAQLGEIHREAGQTEQAAALYQRSLHTDWSQTAVRQRLAMIRKSAPPRQQFAGNYPPVMQASHHGPQPFQYGSAIVQSPPATNPAALPSLAAPTAGTSAFDNADPAHVPQLSESSSPRTF